MPADPEEMQAMLAKARGTTNRSPPEFMRLTGPLRMITMSRPNDGFIFTAGIPFSQRFQSSFTWQFSNKKAPEIEIMCMLAGAGGPMMGEDQMSFINVSTGSSGRLAVQAQKPIGYGIKASTEIEMAGLDPNMCMSTLNLKKDFHNSHLQYQYQGIHMLNYMRSVTDRLTAGVSAAYIPMHRRTIFSYGAKWDVNENTFLASYSPMNPQEKMLVAVVSKPSRRLHLFSELKFGQDNKSALNMGYRARFNEGMITGSITSAGKASTVYRKFIDMFEVTVNGSMDFAKPAQPVQFGLSFGLGGGM